MQAGSGNINLSSTGTITLTGNTSLNNGTLRLNGLTYTFPRADGSDGQALTTNAAGTLRWANPTIAADSLDFTEFKDEMTLDADTSINGDYSLIVRAGLGAVQNSTSGNNDIQLAAEDRLDLFATSYSLTTSGNSVDILSGGRIDLSAKGTLTLDTSQNNSQILIRAGTGRVDVSGNTILVNAGTGTLTLSSSGGITIGGEGATTRVSGDLNFTGRLLEDGNEVLGNIIAAYNGSCPTGWTEYTAARGRTVVGTPAAGTNAGTVGTALTNLEDRTHTHTGPSHTHTYTDVIAHTHSITTYYVGGTGGGIGVNNTSTSAGTGGTLSTGIATGTTAASGTGATGTAATSDVMPYIQLTYCQKTAGADYAEWTRSREQYSPGTVVSADPQASEQIKISETSYDSTMLGIISTTPGWTVGVQTADSLQLALNGRVPVKIDPDSEPIAVGDFLTSSDKPGLAMKATKMGYTVGKALESWTLPSNEQGQGTKVQGQTKDTIMVFVNLGTYLGPLTADGYIDTQQKFIAQDVKVDLRTETYRRLMSELNLPTELQKVQPFMATEVSQTSVPALSPDPATVSASVAEVLSVLAEKLDKTEDRLAVLESQQRPGLPSEGQALSEFTLSGSYMDSELALTAATELTVDGSDESYVVYGSNVTHILSSATVGGSLTVGLLTIDDLNASINSMGGTLKLQNLGLADIEFMGGKIVIDTQGNLKVEGEITAEKVNIDTSQPATASAGQAVIALGETEIEITTAALTTKSLIFVTPEGEPVAVATEKSGSDKFIIRIGAPLTADLKVNWWVVN